MNKNLLILLLLLSCASSIPKLETSLYTNRLVFTHMSCERQRIKFLSLLDDKNHGLEQCKFIKSVKKHKSSTDSPCPDLFQYLSKEGTHKVVLAPIESAFVMGQRKREKVDIYECQELFYKALVQTEKELKDL